MDKESWLDKWIWQKAKAGFFEFLVIAVMFCCVVGGINYTCQVWQGLQPSCEERQLILAEVERTWSHEAIPPGKAECESMHLAILQIQATVVTLALTIITIVSGMSKDSMFGISVTNYYLNKQVRFLTQKVVLGLVLGGLAANVLLYLMGYRYMVLPIFFATITLILYSAFAILKTFKGSKEIAQEISVYCWGQFTGKEKREDPYELLRFFESDWSKVPVEDSTEYDKYRELYQIAIDNLLAL